MTDIKEIECDCYGRDDHGYTHEPGCATRRNETENTSGQGEIHIDWSKITDNIEVIAIIKSIRVLENKARILDPQALIKYEIEMLSQ